MTKQRPILFSTPMVASLLNTTKTQTRRVVNFPKNWDGDWEKVKCPYGKVGDVLWVKETSCYVMSEHAPDLLEGAKDKTQWVYKSGVHSDWMEYAKEKYGYKWTPSIFMPKHACRIWLEIVSVKTERLQEISEEDAEMEGAERYYYGHLARCKYKNYATDQFQYINAIDSFKSLWESINGAESWNENPWVWVIEFKMVPKPIEP